MYCGLAQKMRHCSVWSWRHRHQPNTVQGRCPRVNAPSSTTPIWRKNRYQAPRVSVVMEIKAVSVEILDGELPQPPGLLLQRFNDVRTERFELSVCRIEIVGEHPVNGRLKRCGFLPKEDRHISTRHGPDLVVRIQPGNLKTECISIMLLRPLDVNDGQFRHRRRNRRQGPDRHGEPRSATRAAT